MSFGMFPGVGKRGKRRSCQLMERTASEHGAQTAFRNQRHSERSRAPFTKSWVTLRDLLFSAQCGRRAAVSSLPRALAPVALASFSLPKRLLFLATPICPTWLASENPVATCRRCKNEIGARLQPHRDVWAKATPVY